MHSLRFPKTLTIQLPELLREGLQKLQDRELDRGPAELLEAVLAAGLKTEVLHYPDSLDDASPSGELDSTDDLGAAMPQPLHLELNAEQTARVLRILNSSPVRTPSEVASWLLEWGLDAFEESLKIIDSHDTSRGVGRT